MLFSLILCLCFFLSKFVLAQLAFHDRFFVYCRFSVEVSSGDTFGDKIMYTQVSVGDPFGLHFSFWFNFSLRIIFYLGIQLWDTLI